MHRTTKRWFVGISFFVLATLGLTKPAHAADHRSRVVSRWQQVTHASWYGNEFRGHSTANGSRFDPRGLTAAHRTLRLGTKVRVTSLNSGKSVVVEITDRGPYVKGRGIDLSHAAARSIGMVGQGVARVAIEVVTPKASESPAAAPVVMAANPPTVWWLPQAIVR